MARAFRLWLEPDPDPVPGHLAARAARLTADPGRFDARAPWAQPEVDPEWPLGAPWGLLLAFLNLERRVPPYDWPRQSLIERLAPDWEDWKRFQRETGAPYLLAEDQGHPLLWFPATDGEMWGFLFNFGLRGGGGWYWWVPGTQRVVKDPNTGATMLIMGETHPEVPDGKTLRDLLAEAPAAGLFDVAATQFLTVQEALDGELQHHVADERNRCRFFVYPATVPAHGLTSDGTYGLQTLDAQREAIASVAWSCLSRQPALWDPVRSADWRSEIGGHANPEPDDAETEKNLAARAPADRYRRMGTRTFWGPTQQGFAYDGDPLAPFLERLTPEPRVVPTTGCVPFLWSRQPCLILGVA